MEERFLGGLATDELEVTLAVEREADVRASSLQDQWKLRIERAEFEARRAERRYKAVDPENRVVARTLERDWEERLQDLEAVRRDFESARREHRVQLTERDRARIRALASDLPSVWRAPTTSRADQKAMLRIAIEAITIQPIDVPARQTHIRMQWKGGAIDEMTIARPTTAVETRTPREWEDMVVALVGEGLDDKTIASRMATALVETPAQTRWTAEKVKRIRLRRNLKRPQSEAPKLTPLPDRHPDGRYSIAAAAKRLGVCRSTIRSRIARGLLQASQEDFGWKRGATWVDLDGDHT